MNSHVNPLMADILNSFAHGITRTGPAKVGGAHLSDAANEPGDLTREDLAAIDAEFAPAPYSEEWLAQADKGVQARKDEECSSLTRACDEREMRRSTFGSELDRATWMRT